MTKSLVVGDHSQAQMKAIGVVLGEELMGKAMGEGQLEVDEVTGKQEVILEKGPITLDYHDSSAPRGTGKQGWGFILKRVAQERRPSNCYRPDKGAIDPSGLLLSNVNIFWTGSPAYGRSSHFMKEVCMYVGRLGHGSC